MGGEPSSKILLIVLILLALSAFFSGSEAALLSISHAKVRTLRNHKKWGSESLEWLKNRPRKFIIAILIGNNIVNILITVLTTYWVTTKFGDQTLGLITGILTVLILVFGEILPKSLGQHFNTRVSLSASPVLSFITKGLFPFVWIFEKLSESLIGSRAHDPITEDEVLAMVSLGTEGGAIKKEEQELIENVLEFSETTAGEVMTPRTDIDVLDGETPLGKAVDFFIERSHSRIPVYEDNIDNIIGIITIKQTLKAWKEYEEHKLIKNLDMKKPLFVPTTRRISELFKDFQRNRLHMAVVVDEHGGTAGIITLEDVLEEVFGEIVDETDEEDDIVLKISNSTWVVPGNITLDELKDEVGIDLRKKKGDEGKMLSLSVLEMTGRIPARGESVETPKAVLVIERMEGRKIDRVRIIKK